MSRRPVVLALVALALGATLLASKYLRWETEARRPAAPAARLRPLEPSVAERLARIDGRLRLPPDRRAMAAVGEIRRLVLGGPSPEAEASYASGSWKIAHEGEPIGVLSGFPRFSALLSLLDEWAARERAKPGAVQLVRDPEIRPELQGRLNRFDDAAAFEVLSEVDAIWREGRASVGDLLAATEALAQLCAILPRDLPAADRLAARAFASLALARQHAAERTLRAEITLAFATGYVTHARAIAERLPGEEALTAFIRADLAALERASRSSRSGHVDFLYGARLASARPIEEWIAWHEQLPRKRALQTAVVRTALEEPAVPAGQFVPELYATVLLTRFGVPLDKGRRTESVLTRCDVLSTRLEKAAQGQKGPFADSALYADSYREACVFALYRKLAFFLDGLKHPDAALELARSLPQGAGPDLETLRDWTELVAGDGASNRDAARLSKALANPLLGAAPHRALARRGVAALTAADPRRFDVADAAAARLDSRASGRLFAGELARDVYRDPALEERLYAATVDLDGVERATLVSEVASLRRDWEALWSMAESPAYRLDERMAALGALEQQKPIEAARVRRGYEDLLQGNPDSAPLRRQFARYLDEQLGNHRAARNVLLPILTALEADDPAADALAATIARLHLEDGDARSAWELLEPRLAGAAARSAATRAQIALGNLDRAEEIVRATVARDPYSLSAAADLSAVLWGAKRFAEAAQVIAKFPSGASDSDRCWSFCRAFVRTFTGKPSGEAEAAFRELVAARPGDPLLLGTVVTFREAAEAETAFALGHLIRSPGRILEIHTESYKSLKELRGQAEAVRWLATKIPGEKLAAAAKVYYSREADELLWRLVGDPDVQGGSTTWLLRAAAFVRERKPDPAHRAALAAYFGAHQKTADEQLGAALIGLIDEDALLAGARSEADLSKAAYFLGARAEGARDFHRAMRLYQLALASHHRTPGRGLAHQAVARIQGLHASLDVLAAERAPSAILASGR